MRLTRMIGTQKLDHLDPFLLVDESTTRWPFMSTATLATVHGQ